MLADAYPAREIEVVNCGVTAINSFVVREFVEEVSRARAGSGRDLRWSQRVRGAVRGRDSVCASEWQLVLHPVQMFLQRTKTYYLLDSLLHYVVAALRPAAPTESFGVHLVQREIYLRTRRTGRPRLITGAIWLR